MTDKIRFAATENWSVSALQLFLHQLNILYNRLYVINDLRPGSRRKLDSILDSSLSRVPKYAELLVDHVEIQSPAKFSLEGVDGIIGQLRGLIKDVSYANRLEKEQKEQEIKHQAEKQRIEIQKDEAELLKKQIAVLKNAGFSADEIKPNLRKLMDPLERVSSLMLENDIVLTEEKGQSND